MKANKLVNNRDDSHRKPSLFLLASLIFLTVFSSGCKNNNPQIGAISPSSGSSTANTETIFTAAYSDPDGWKNLADCRLLVNASSAIKNTLCVKYDQNANKLYLIKDNNSNESTGWQGGFSPGSKNTIQNSYCKLNCAKTTVSGSGNTLTIKWAVTFKPAFTGKKNTYLYVKDDKNSYVNWVKKGAWEIKAADTTPPSGTIKINNGAAYTASATVTLNLQAYDNPGGSGMDKMQFSENGTSWSSAETYAVTKTRTLTSTNGQKTVYVKFSDKSANWSKAVSGTVILDTVSPSGTVLINNGDSSSESLEVVLTLKASDTSSGMGTGAQMKFSNDNSSWSTPEAYATTKSWTLKSGSGEKTVYVKFKDVAGNWSLTATDKIIVSIVPKERMYIYLNNQRVAMEESGKKFFYHNDHLGGTSVVTDEAGAQVKHLEYQPFGETKTEEGSKKITNKFTGKELDDSTGLYNFLARLYDPKIGRFITADPIQFSDMGVKLAGGTDLQTFLANPQNLNRYSYCLNNPIRYTDPDGLLVALGEKAVKVLGIDIGSHTAIILHPDKSDDFKNDTSTKWYTNSKGELEATLSANPNWKSSFKSPFFGNLKATPSISGDRPLNLKNKQPIIDQEKRSDTQLIRDIITSANKYKDNLSYDPIPCLFDSFHNSNSYTYGVLKDARIANIPNLPGWQPGADKPILLNKKE